MSEYFLADRRAKERARQREQTTSKQAPTEMTATLLGDFLFPSTEPTGCDPYNATHGKSGRVPWKNRADRR